MKRLARRPGSVLLQLGFWIACVAAGIPSHAASPVRLADPPQAPPSPPPPLTRPASSDPVRPRQHDAAGTLYPIGQPTDEEQLYLEFINRARANPPDEGIRLRDTTDPDVVSAYNVFGVNLTLMASEFAAINPAPPLAMNEQLMRAARLHTQDMFTNAFQGHAGSDGRTLAQRIEAQGYNWQNIAENVFSFADSVWHGHAGFNVDWGNGPDGMQTPRGHRNSIHNATYREVGIGVVLGSNGSVGPQLVTQDFGTRQGATPLVTGVVYFDLNGNQFYDLGEGIGGVLVCVAGSSFYAMTADSGGYTVPVPGNGGYTVIFSATGMETNEQPVTVASSANLKVDHVPPYSPPIVSGPDPAGLNVNNTYSFNPVAAAVGHQWEQTRLAPYTRVEGAEQGLDHVTVVSSPGYSVVESSVSASGGSSFHLAHPNPPSDQSILLNATLKPASNSELSFRTRLGWATANQVARVHISTDDGMTWQGLWSQAGTENQGQTSFQSQTVSLSAFAGEPIRLRFVYDHTSGGFFPQTDPDVGWLIDDIAVSNAEEFLDSMITDVASGTSFVFTPTTTDSYSLRVRAEMSGGRRLAWGPAMTVSVTDAVAPSIRLTGAPAFADGQLLLNFTLESGSAPNFDVYQADQVSGPWSVVTGATINDLGGGNFEVQLSAPATPQRFYRIAIP